MLVSEAILIVEILVKMLSSTFASCLVLDRFKVIDSIRHWWFSTLHRRYLSALTVIAHPMGVYQTFLSKSWIRLSFRLYHRCSGLKSRWFIYCDECRQDVLYSCCILLFQNTRYGQLNHFGAQLSWMNLFQVSAQTKACFLRILLSSEQNNCHRRDRATATTAWRLTHLCTMTVKPDLDNSPGRPKKLCLCVSSCGSGRVRGCIR